MNVTAQGARSAPGPVVGDGPATAPTGHADGGRPAATSTGHADGGRPAATSTRAAGRVIAAARRWPARRWVAAVPVLPALTALFALTGGSGLAAPAVGWAWPWAVVTAIPATVTLVSYVPVPGSRRLLDIGCSPCAAAAALSVVGADVLHAIAPASPFLAVLATGMATMGARRRVSQAQACPAGPGSAGPGSAGPGSAGPGSAGPGRAAPPGTA